MNNKRQRGDDMISKEVRPSPRPLTLLVVVATCALLLFAGFIALGTWQVQRLHWKRALIERIEERVHAAPVAAPGPERWSQITAESDEYRRVQVTGTLLHPLATRIQATTVLGSGYWILTPLHTVDGHIVMINRGFVPLRENSASDGIPSGPAQSTGPLTTITGLLRITEPNGAFLRRNDPEHNRWYSRDIAAIAKARNLSQVAPYFIDADAASAKMGHPAGVMPQPTGGLTVISFPDNHFVYAVTWYVLALMVLAAGLWVVRDELALRRHAGRSTGPRR